MDRARDVLTRNSFGDLQGVGWALEAGLEERRVDLRPQDAVRLGRSLFTNLAELLRAAIDEGDSESFEAGERQWTSLFEDVWFPGFPTTREEGFSERLGAAPRRETVELLRRREVLRLGLVMWVVWHLVPKADVDPASVQAKALQLLTARFPSVEYVFDAYDAATQEDVNQGLPFTDWFLSELPTGAAHFIPTQTALLRAALLLAVRLTTATDPAALRPRDWFEWRKDEIDRELQIARGIPEKWASAFGLSQLSSALADAESPENWASRLARLEELIEEGRRGQRELERVQLRDATVDLARVASIRDAAIKTAVDVGVVRAILRHQGAVELVPQQPADIQALATRNWAPKSFVTQESRVVAVDLVGRDLGSSAGRFEEQQLIETLPKAPARPTRTDEIGKRVSWAIDAMRETGFRPSLIVTPISWRLQEALGLTRVGRSEVSHPLIPAGHAKRFAGVLNDVPVIELADAPEERLWIIDVSRAVQMVEWPSDEQSGIRFELRSFDASTAAAFLEENPSVRGNRTVDDTVRDLQEKVLISVYLCWFMTSGEPGAAEVIQVPEDLRRN